MTDKAGRHDGQCENRTYCEIEFYLHYPRTRIVYNFIEPIGDERAFTTTWTFNINHIPMTTRIRKRIPKTNCYCRNNMIRFSIEVMIFVFTFVFVWVAGCRADKLKTKKLSAHSIIITITALSDRCCANIKHSIKLVAMT